MKRKDKKKIMIIGGAISSIILVSMLGVAIFSPEKDIGEEKLPGIEEFGEETVDLGQVEGRMIEDGEVVYWNIGRPSNGTDMILITGVQLLISWSDDERGPITRPLYQNVPDRFYVTIEGVPLLSKDFSKDGNQTNQTEEGVVRVTSNSDIGTLRANLDILSNPVPLEAMEGSNGTSWGWDPDGSPEKGNTGLFINITCVAGNIEGMRPLVYNDPGDEITMNVKILYKSVPEEVVFNWLENQGTVD